MFVTSFRIKASESLEKQVSKSYLQRIKMEKRRERALHNLRMPKNISDTLACGSAPLLCFNHILTSSVIYYWTDPRQYGISLFNNTRKISLHTRPKLGSFSTHFFSTNLPNFFPFVLVLSFPNALWLAYICKWVISELTWGRAKRDKCFNKFDEYCQ